ncbi:WG repeat-containing protein [candidate division KSB1 bacterium]|nr:WG repeat-containing protein [candidate division KSB1 bacterium]
MKQFCPSPIGSLSIRSKPAFSIGLIFTIQWIVRGRLPAKWQHTLWLILIVRLLLPSGLESNLSLYNLFNRSDGALETTTRIINQPIWIEANTMDGEPVTETESSRQISIVDIFSAIWILGTLTFALITLIANMKCWMRIRSRRPISDKQTLQCFHECQQRMQIRQSVQLAKLDSIQIPMLYRWLKPVILLPSSQISKWTPDQFKHIVCHELAHHKRRDILVAHLTTILQILHWFNPLMWLAFYKIRLDREVACDAIALNHLGRDQSKSYGSTILSLLENISSENLLPMTVGIVESKKNLKRRLTSIAKFKKPKLMWTLIGVLIALTTGLIVLTEAKKDKLDSISNENNLNVDDSADIFNTDDQSFSNFTQNLISSPVVSFRENGKTGLKDHDGNIILEPEIANIGLFSEGLALYATPTGIFNTVANILPRKLDYTRSLAKWKCGFIDQKGNIVIKPQYDWAGMFHEGLAPVKINDKFGYINKSGELVIDFQYDSADLFFNGLAAVQKNDKTGYIDEQGKVIIPFIYEKGKSFSEGLAPVMQNLKWGFINKTGEFVITPQFKQIGHFSEGFARFLGDNEKWGFINKSGEVAIQPQYEWILTDFSDGTARVISEDGTIDIKGDHHTRIDNNGNMYSTTMKINSNTSELQQTGYTIILDPGHGGRDPGGKTTEDRMEKDMTLEICTKLARTLEANGMHVQMTRATDSFISLEDRGKIINDADADIALSIHVNNNRDTTKHGICFYHHQENDNSSTLCDALQNALQDNIWMDVNKIYTAGFYLSRIAEIPVSYIELGYMTSSQDLETLSNPEFIDDCCERISTAVLAFLENESEG